MRATARWRPVCAHCEPGAGAEEAAAAVSMPQQTTAAEAALLAAVAAVADRTGAKARIRSRRTGTRLSGRPLPLPCLRRGGGRMQWAWQEGEEEEGRGAAALLVGGPRPSRQLALPSWAAAAAAVPEEGGEGGLT